MGKITIMFLKVENNFRLELTLEKEPLEGNLLVHRNAQQQQIQFLILQGMALDRYHC